MVVAAMVRFSDRRRRVHRWVFLYRLVFHALLLAAVSFSGGAFPVFEAAAHGPDHPAPLRNVQNQFALLQPPEPAPITPFLTVDGKLVELGRFRGKLVLLNFWATWCVPCIRELPALDRLQSALGGDKFAVIALSIDEGAIDVPASFLRRLGLKDLNVYLDVTGSAAKAFSLFGLPITYLIDQNSSVVGYITGAVEWDSPAAIKFLKHYLE
jgi:thiol-disulfide isomerase/thioredoxin